MDNSVNLLTTQKNMMQSDFEESERMLKQQLEVLRT